MKIRNGFVSNSSSSSFMIYGTYLDKSEIIAKAKSILTPEQIQEVFFDEDGNEIDLDSYDFDFDYSLGDKLSKKLGEGIYFYGGYEDEGRYIGASASSFKDEETGAQFKARVGDALKLAFGNVSLGFHSEVVYN
jgi:hypothetical protein